MHARTKRETVERIKTMAAGGMSNSDIAQEVGVCRQTVYNVLRREDTRDAVVAAASAPAEQERTDVNEDGSRGLRYYGTRVRTVDDARREGGVDGDGWRVRRARVEHWEVGMKGLDGRPLVQPLWLVEVTVEPVGQDEVQWERVLARTAEAAATWAPVYDEGRLAKREVSTGRMLELDILDAHVGMYAWAGEVGRSWDLDLATTTFGKAVDRLLDLSGRYPVEQVVIPFGNDYLHADTEKRTTTSEKVDVDMDTRATKVFEQAKLLAVKVIDRLLTVAPMVVVPIVPGNHDRLSMIHLGHVLAAWYRVLGDRVQVDFSPPSRKYVRWGACLIGYEHGKDIKRDRLPMIMAHERARDWAETRHRRWRLGHLHHKSHAVVIAEDIGSVEIVQSRALAPVDAYGYNHGFVGAPNGGSATVWDRTDGPVAEFEVRL